jgi:hypothetical protein
MGPTASEFIGRQTPINGIYRQLQVNHSLKTNINGQLLGISADKSTEVWILRTVYKLLVFMGDKKDLIKLSYFRQHHIENNNVSTSSLFQKKKLWNNSNIKTTLSGKYTHS